MFFLFVQGTLALLALIFLVYALLELESARKGTRGRRSVLAKRRGDPGCDILPRDFEAACPGGQAPFVSVLLPVCNEKLVVNTLLLHVCSLVYPKGRLEILLLDDSTDETRQIAAEAVERYRRRGIDIRYLRREKRRGFKAGNLAYGLSRAKGEYIAIFDADCFPPSNFLIRVMPLFADEKVGFLQTSVRHANAYKTFLTGFQAMECGHKDDVTLGLSKDGFMVSLTGTSCVWRRSCIEAIGGISSDTITEDVDMGYRAQLTRWSYKWVPDVTSWAEFPETMAAFRVQRQRWARGLVQNAVRHVKKVFASSMGLLARLHVLSLMFSSLLLAAMYAILLLCLPTALFLHTGQSPFFHASCVLFLCSAILWGWLNTCTHRKVSPVRRFWEALSYVLMHFPISLYYFASAVQVALGLDGNFNRTPKGYGRKKITQPRVNKILLALEIFSFFYACTCLFVGFATRNWWISFYAGLAMSGFAMTLFFSFSDSRKRCTPSCILLTGATGSLGRALALEYASPETALILHGRKHEALEELASLCRQKGAHVETTLCDLSVTEEVRTWAASLCERHPIDLVIANAGQNTNTGPDDQGEDFETVQTLFRVNLLSVTAIFDAVLPHYRKSGGGQFAIMSSLAGSYGLARTPSYCASKAALRSLGTSWRGWLAKEGIHVNVIQPGYIESPMCRDMPGPKPFLMKPERAAHIIRKGLERDYARISFPFPLNLGVWGLALLPAFLATPIARVLGYGPK